MASLAAAFLAFAAGHSLTPLFGSEAFGKSSGQFNQCVHLICMLPCDHPQSMTGEDDQRLLKLGKVVRFAARPCDNSLAVRASHAQTADLLAPIQI